MPLRFHCGVKHLPTLNFVRRDWNLMQSLLHQLLAC